MSQGSAKGLAINPGWTDYAPTLTNITEGNGTVQARYHQVGTHVSVKVLFTLGSTSAIGTSPRFSLPIPAAAWYGDLSDGNLSRVKMKDTGGSGYFGVTYFTATDTAVLEVQNAASTYLTTSTITSTVPFTWGTGDWFLAELEYEAAASDGILIGRNNDHGGLSGLSDDDHPEYPRYTEWQDYTPTYSGGGLTVGNGTVHARYAQIGKTVLVKFNFVLGSTSSIDGADPYVSLPVTAAALTGGQVDNPGTAIYLESGVNRFIGGTDIVTTTAFALNYTVVSSTYLVTGGITAALPFTWGTADTIGTFFAYEAASAY